MLNDLKQDALSEPETTKYYSTIMLHYVKCIAYINFISRFEFFVNSTFDYLKEKGCLEKFFSYAVTNCYEATRLNVYHDVLKNIYLGNELRTIAQNINLYR
jgi:hypothetical protein